MPGPLAAQLAIALGYFQHGVLGATAVGLAFVLPSFLMVVAISMAYVRYGGLWWMQALFYGIGAAVIAIIAIAAYKLARSTNKRDPLLWGDLRRLLALSRCGLRPSWPSSSSSPGSSCCSLARGGRPDARRSLSGWAAVLAVARHLADSSAGSLSLTRRAASTCSLQILVFFTKAGAFVFGSGLAIVPFLQQGVVQQFGWLNEHQFLDAVAVAMITPGPVVITVVFIGYLVAGLLGGDAGGRSASSCPSTSSRSSRRPWFSRNRDNALLKAFVQGATAAATGAHRRRGGRARPARDLRRADGGDRRWRAWPALALQDRRSRSSWPQRAVVGLIVWPPLPDVTVASRPPHSGSQRRSDADRVLSPSMAGFLWEMRPYFRQVAGPARRSARVAGIVMNTAVVLPAILLGRAIDRALALERGEATPADVGWAALLFVGGTLADRGARASRSAGGS